MTNIINTKDYIKYAYDIIDKKIKSGKYIQLACKRFIDWFSRDDIYFDYEIVDKKIKFINCMKHYQGSFAGKPFILMGWESWVLANLWGWKWKSDDTNVINKALISMSRKNAKTAICAAIALCHVIFDERGAEVDLLANSSQQASIAFDHTYHFARSLDKKEKVFKRYRQSIKIPKTDSVILVHSADSGTKDGFNSSLFIMDEFGASHDWDLYNVFLSSMGMRKNPLAIVISTAGFLQDGYPMFEYVKSCKHILDNIYNDDSQFSAIYMLDDNDDWQDEDNWIKSNPSLGETVTLKYLRDQKKMAIQQPGTETSTKTKNFNMFCQSSETWITNEILRKHSIKFELEDLVKLVDDRRELECYVGIDLSSNRDLTALSVCVPIKDKLYFKSWSFLPEETINNAGLNSQLYRDAVNAGLLIPTPGNTTDYDYVTNVIIQINEIIPIVKIAYDRALSNYWSKRFEEDYPDIPLYQYSQSLFNFTVPTKELERMLYSDTGIVVLDDSPFIRWQFSNVVLKIDHIGNCKPIKDNKASPKKIDNIITILMALGTYMLTYDNQCFGAFSVEKQ